MSEYQYYEFQTVDRRLTEKEMQELRMYSTRARITPTGFSNEYNFGSFKGNPDAWMEKYFDGFLYLANWGTRELQLAVPAKVLPSDTARRYCSNQTASVRKKSGKLIFTFLLEEEPSGEWVEGAGCLASLLPIRRELAQGDNRILYLGWLLNVQVNELDPTEAEPPVPPNLGRLSAAQECFVDFFNLDPDLLAAAAQSSPHTAPEPTDRKQLSSWIESLPSKEKDEMLVRLAAGENANLGMELQAQFHRLRDSKQLTATRRPRLISELLRAAETHRADRPIHLRQAARLHH